MEIKTAGILSPGEMGQAIGAVLREHGLRVVTALEGRSARTRRLAAEAGIEDLGSVERLVAATDLLLSVLVPAAAEEVAMQAAAAARSLGKDLLYADCNAVAPRKARAMEACLRAAGGRFVDASIIGPPPRRPGATRIYASGPEAARLAALRDYGLDIRVIGDAAGQASGLKMCYAALTKGLAAIGTELLVAARRMELDGPLAEELSQSQKMLLETLARSVPGMPPKAHRWIGEMEEIAATFGALGLTPRIYEGVADLYRFVAETPLGRETPEGRDRSRGLEEVIEALAAGKECP